MDSRSLVTEDWFSDSWRIVVTPWTDPPSTIVESEVLVALPTKAIDVGEGCAVCVSAMT